MQISSAQRVLTEVGERRARNAATRLCVMLNENEVEGFEYVYISTGDVRFGSPQV